MRKDMLLEYALVVMAFASIGLIFSVLIAIVGKNALASLIVMAVMLVGGMITLAYTSNPECNCECRCVLEEGDDDP